MLVLPVLPVLPCDSVGDDLDSECRLPHGAEGLLDEVLVHVGVQLKHTYQHMNTHEHNNPNPNPTITSHKSKMLLIPKNNQTSVKNVINTTE